MKLLLVDGSNIVMRASFGGKFPPEQSTPTATGMIERAIRELEATHLVVAFDCPGIDTWRKKIYPEYKADRTTDTRPWIEYAHMAWSRLFWWVEAVNEFEADDVIATISRRAQERFEVLILSSDSDLLQISEPKVCVCRPVNGGGVSAMTADMVCAKYSVAAPRLLVDLKALTGEKGDNVPGVQGIGPVRAAELLSKYGDLDGVIKSGESNACPMSAKVAASADTARMAHRLVTLDKQVPITAISPRNCAIR